MKKFLVLLLALLIVASLPTGCGKDGLAGLAFIAHDWIYVPYYYNDNNSSTPPTIYKGQDYQTPPGTYSFDYQAWDGSVWVGTYTIEVNPGEKGGLIADGDDGADRNYTLYLYSTGPSFNYFKAAQDGELELLNEAGVERTFEPELSGSPSAKEYTLDSEVFTEELVTGNMIITMEYQRAYLK